jgi:hypothetical protein
LAKAGFQPAFCCSLFTDGLCMTFDASTVHHGRGKRLPDSRHDSSPPARPADRAGIDAADAGTSPETAL